MPMYEYTCSACGKKFDALVFGDTKVVCESCGSARIKKAFSSFAVHGGPTRGAGTRKPICAGGCGGGFEQGSCGSGMCGGGN